MPLQKVKRETMTSYHTKYRITTMLNTKCPERPHHYFALPAESSITMSKALLHFDKNITACLVWHLFFPFTTLGRSVSLPSLRTPIRDTYNPIYASSPYSRCLFLSVRQRASLETGLTTNAVTALSVES